MAATMAPRRQYDIVLFGSTGYTGKLVASHLAKHAPKMCKIALVGRSEARLREVQLKNSDWDIITGVDLKDCHAVESVVKKSRVVLSTAGPYAILGDALVQSCVKCKTDYVDITGEIHWVEQNITKYHRMAYKNNTRIVHCCGYDSVPMDLSALLLLENLDKERSKCSEKGAIMVEGFVGKSFGGFSGGTLASAFNIMDYREKSRKKTVTDAPVEYSKLEDDCKIVENPPDQWFVGYSEYHMKATFPSVMQSVNTRVVRRSAELLGYNNVEDKNVSNFLFSESTLSPTKSVAYVLSTISLFTSFLLMKIPFVSRQIRKLLKALIVKQGAGPSEETRNNGYHEYFCVAKLENKSNNSSSDSNIESSVVQNDDFYVTRFTGQQDPGYGDTSIMVAEAALSLAFDDFKSEENNRLYTPLQGGVLTPASAFGLTLMHRLSSFGMKLESVQPR